MQRIVNVIFLSLVFCSCHSQQQPAIHSDSTLKKDSQNKTVSQSAKDRYAEAIDPLYKKLLLQKGFNGSILMAKYGEIVFEDYHGYSNVKTKEPLTANTPIHLASISKTFTGMTVLHLWEQGRISLDENVQHYFPNFPYANITIRSLLSHQSGLPKYEYFMDGHKFETYYVLNKKGKKVKRTRTLKDPNVPEVKGLITLSLIHI